MRAALEQHPGVAEAAVIGVTDERLGAVPVAVVERQGGQQVDEAAVLATASAHLARYEVPVKVIVVDAMPRTASGKADLAAVRELATETAARLMPPNRFGDGRRARRAASASNVASSPSR